MEMRTWLILIFMLMSVVNIGFAQPTSVFTLEECIAIAKGSSLSQFRGGAKAAPSDSSFLRIINRLIVYDQVARGNREYTDTTTLNADSLKNAAMQVDSINREIIKPLISRYGWPGISGLGSKGDIDLWALVQHADEDVKFQQQVLDLLETEVLRGNTRKANYAYLYDRVCVNLGYAQLFGTQAKQADENGFELHPLQDSVHVDVYRKAFGLGSLEDYVEFFKKKVERKK